MRREIEIAGGGLAGLALAAGLRVRGVPVVVHEAGRYPRHRVCGEFISGVERATLERLGIGDLLEDAERLRGVAWYREGRTVVESRLPAAALGVSRWRLDERLCGRVRELGGRVMEGSRMAREAAEGRVWAAGRLPRKSGWLGLKCHVRDFAMRTELEMHLGTNGYAGLAPVEEGRVNVCGLFRLDRAMKGEGSELLLNYLRAGGNGELAGRLAEASRDENSFQGVAGFELGWQGAEEGLCAVGDAEGMIPPFTGNGMSMAFESAELAVEPLVRWSSGGMEWEAVVSELRAGARRKFRRRVAAGMALHRLILNGRGQRLVEALSRAGMLPFRPLLSLVR